MKKKQQDKRFFNRFEYAKEWLTAMNFDSTGPKHFGIEFVIRPDTFESKSLQVAFTERRHADMKCTALGGSVDCKSLSWFALEGRNHFLIHQSRFLTPLEIFNTSEPFKRSRFAHSFATSKVKANKAGKGMDRISGPTDVLNQYENTIQLVNTIRQNICKQKLINSEEQLLLSFSGGQDSICLLLVFYILQTQINCHFDCIWMNHFWQKSSFFTMLHVSKCGISFSSALRLSLPLKTVDKNQQYSEEKARNWRHFAAQRLAFFYGHSICAQGHSKSDRVETILFNLIRGTGMSGLSALRWMRKQETFSANKKYPISSHFMEQTHIQTEFFFPVDEAKIFAKQARNRIFEGD